MFSKNNSRIRKNSTFELDMLLICFIIYNDVLYFADDFYVLMLYFLLNRHILTILNIMSVWVIKYATLESLL